MTRRIAVAIFASVLGLIGATLIWTAIWYVWFYVSMVMAPFDASTTESTQSLPVPAVGIIAMYYLIHLGFVPALAIMIGFGVATCILAYVVVRRFALAR